MKPLFSIIYAHRDRDAKRIKISFESLKNQRLQNFEVVLVDYGSEYGLVKELETIVEEFTFATLYHLPVRQLLWNKSRALNYGILKSQGEYIFIADIDLIFHRETTLLWQKIGEHKKFYLFKLGYLNKKESLKLSKTRELEELEPVRFGDVNGMILSKRESFVEINGFDEFFHFYGAEDEDLFARLENAGYIKEQREEEYYYHQWHKGFSASEGEKLTRNPRVKDIMRINYSHFQRNRERRIIKPLRQQGMGRIVSFESAKTLNTPDLIYKIPNMLILIEHFLREELPSRRGEVVRVEFFEDKYFRSLKYKLKNLAGMQSQPYISLKEINDMVLKKILYNYRDHNYSYRLEDDLSRIIFCIEV